MTAGFLISALGHVSAWRQIWEYNEILQDARLKDKYGMLQSTWKAKDSAVTLRKDAPQAPLKAAPVPRVDTKKSVAVVIPVLVLHSDHVAKLRRALLRIQQQSLVPSAVYLVDDGSPIPLAMHLPESAQAGWTILRSACNEGPAAARNKGLQAARDAGHEYVCFTDADCLPEKTWVESIVQHFEWNVSDDIFGGVTHALNDGAVDHFHDFFGTLNGRLLPDNTLLYAPTCNMGVRLRTVFGGFRPMFDEPAFEDIDFCIEARKAGATLKLVENARVVHDYDSSLGGLFRQYARYGRSWRRMEKLHPYYASWLAGTKGIPVKSFFKI